MKGTNVATMSSKTLAALAQNPLEFKVCLSWVSDSQSLLDACASVSSHCLDSVSAIIALLQVVIAAALCVCLAIVIGHLVVNIDWLFL